MRTIKRAIGAVFGLLIVNVYYVWLRFNKRGRKWEAVFDDNTHAEILRGARGVVNAGAVTFGGRIFSRRKFPSFQLVRHELTHVRQWRKMGWLRFCAVYGAEQFDVGYKGNRLEKEAREHAGI